MLPHRGFLICPWQSHPDERSSSKGEPPRGFFRKREKNKSYRDKIPLENMKARQARGNRGPARSALFIYILVMPIYKLL
jgi:hypothetical protein